MNSMRGSALVITILVAAVLTLLGLGYLCLAQTETHISASDRDVAQLVFTAETGLRMVKAWFDQPVTGDPALSSQVLHRFLETYDLRNPALYDRAQRLLDDDGDPNTPMVLADGSAARPYYRQGRTLWAPSQYLDIFHKPYRGDLVTAFVGTESGPDLLLEDRPGVVDFIDKLNQALVSDQSETGRITRIAIYAAPEIDFGGAPKRAGICTIKVTAAKYRGMGAIGAVPVVTSTSTMVGEASMNMVLNEMPGTSAAGPLESCGPMEIGGALSARWGRVGARGDITLPADLDASVASAYPYESSTRRITGSAPGGDFFVWWNDPQTIVEDPWLRVAASGDLGGWAARPDQPLPYAQDSSPGRDHSNLFQRQPGPDCARFDYRRMKSAASLGEEAARYFAFDPSSGLFREWGAGPARSVRDWTNGQEGLFFFDTIDGREPNGHGPGDPLTNLTPPIVIEDTDWSFSGLLYLDSESFLARNVTGVNRVILPPGEPYDDANGNGRFDAGETFVNLRYPSTIVAGAAGSAFEKDAVASQSGSVTSPDGELYTVTTTAGRDARGIPLTGPINLFGVLYNAGNIVAEGPARHYGTLIAGTAVVQTTPGAATPEILFDQRLETGQWPPAEITMTRTLVTMWGGRR